MFQEQQSAEETKRLTRENGVPPLVPGRFEIEIPGNGIDQQGIEQIQNKLFQWLLYKIPETIVLPDGKRAIWQWEWKVGGKGEYVGALPKRISKLIWQTRQKKLTAAQLSVLGNIGAAHSGRQQTYWFDIVEHADWGRHDFGQPDDCCYWSCHANAKVMILQNGGGAIRFFENAHYGVEHGFARAWLIPWQNCWIVFNGYGLSTLMVARILAVHLKHTYYRRISLENNGTGQGTLWINSGNGGGSYGYLIGPQKAVLRWGHIDLKWEEPCPYSCSICEEGIGEDHDHNPNGEDICENCFVDRCFVCECGECIWLDDSMEAPNGTLFCKSCWETYCFNCECCKANSWESDGIQSQRGDWYCEDCFHQLFTFCDHCGDSFLNKDMRSRIDGEYCKKCVAVHDSPHGNLPIHLRTEPKEE